MHRLSHGEARLITATCGGVEVSSVYVPNGRSVDDPHYGAKLIWLDRLREQLSRTTDPSHPVVVMGDFNDNPNDSSLGILTVVHKGSRAEPMQSSSSRIGATCHVRSARIKF